MSAEDLDNQVDQVAYEQLEDLDEEFQVVELQLLRQQWELSKALYAKREKIVDQIPNFWALVFEQVPPEVDEYIQPVDTNVFVNHFTKLTVDRFELPSGDPRSLLIRFEFSDNEWFENKVLEKRFWWRQSKDGWAGLVSEPVKINWKKGKDLTGGLLDLVCKVWEDDKAGKKGEQTEAKKALTEKMESTGLDGLSFFAWFGFRGLPISEEESKAALKEEEEKRKARAEGKAVEEDDDEDDEDDELDYEDEIFPPADDIAVCIAEDIWPGAIQYFITAQEQDEMSDADFESDEEMGEEEEEEEKPAKKVKA